MEGTQIGREIRRDKTDNESYKTKGETKRDIETKERISKIQKGNESYQKERIRRNVKRETR